MAVSDGASQSQAAPTLKDFQTTDFCEEAPKADSTGAVYAASASSGGATMPGAMSAFAFTHEVNANNAVGHDINAAKSPALGSQEAGGRSPTPTSSPAPGMVDNNKEDPGGTSVLPGVAPVSSSDVGGEITKEQQKAAVAGTPTPGVNGSSTKDGSSPPTTGEQEAASLQAGEGQEAAKQLPPNAAVVSTAGGPVLVGGQQMVRMHPGMAGLGGLNGAALTTAMSTGLFNLNHCAEANPAHPSHAMYLQMKAQMESMMVQSGQDLEAIRQAQAKAERERKINQLFHFVRNMGFDKLRKMVVANQGRDDAFPTKEDLKTAKDPQGHSFLHWSALGGDEDFCRWAVDEVGIPCDSVTFNGQTPLMWATLQGHIQIMRFLIERGADMRRRDSLGATPLLLSMQHKQKLPFFLLVHRDRGALDDVDINGCGAVHWAAYKSDILALKFLDYFQADLNAIDFSRMTALHRAVIGGSIEVCEFLLKKKVSPYLKNKDGEDILKVAEKDKNNPYLASALKESIKKYADPSHVPEQIPEATVIGSAVEEPKGSESPKKKDAGIAGDIKSMVGEPDFQKYAIPSIYLGSASFALYVHVQYLIVVGPQVAPFLTNLVWFMVPSAMALFVYLMNSAPGHWERRPIGRSAVEELMADIDSDTPVEDQRFSRLCTECWIQKDLRTKHCSVTNICVREFDHYCGWLAVPIGRNNNRQFVMLAIWELLAQLAHLFLILYCVHAEAVKDHAGRSAGGMAVIDGVETAVPDESGPGFFGTIYFTVTNCTMIAFVVFLHCLTIPWVCCLTSYHLRLVARNLTTNEVINLNRYAHFWTTGTDANGAPKREFTNPWDKGGAQANCLDFWWWRTRGSYGKGYQSIPMQELDGILSSVGSS
ncbi:unnamed protein product [Amoebophrya sp. A25]|nr:unnamed protein product [Amoebophrya sp. A25]|eukprot:GSA25T00026332001.1